MNSAQSLAGRAITAPLWAQPKFVALVIATYLAVHFAIRMAMWPTLGIDDAEQALFAQQFSWIYRYRAPPLFTWALLGLGRFIGVDIVSISLIRYALLALTFAFSYLAAQRLISDPRLSALSVYSFSAIYVFAYYSHHDLTHTTMMSAMLAVAWYIFLRLAEAPRLGWYVALGVVFGLGLLGKWNFVMFAAALPLACVAVPRFRPLVLNWKTAAAVLAAAIVALPTTVAALRLEPAEGETIGAVLGAGPGASLAQLIEGTAQLLVALIAYPEPLLPLVVLLFAVPLWRGWRAGSAPGEQTPAIALIGLTMAISIGLHLLLVVILGATEFHARLMQPVLLIFPIWLFMLIERGGPSARAVNNFALVLALIAGATAAARIGIYWVGADYCGSCRAMVPFSALGQQLENAGFSGRGTIVAEGFHIGGNMRVEFPDARIADPRYPPSTWPKPRGANQCLLLWREREDAILRAPGRLRAYLSRELGGDVQAPYREGVVSGLMFGSDSRQYRLGYRLYDGAVGKCR